MPALTQEAVLTLPLDFLVLSPPVCTPAEPPSGAFLLASGLAGRGYRVGFFDLSLEFYNRFFDTSDAPTIAAIDYLLSARDGYEPTRHRSATGVLHKHLKHFGAEYPGWKLTLMDLAPPGRIQDPAGLERLANMTKSPFAALWREALNPALDAYCPKQVLLSVAYLSQLPAAIDLVCFLERRGLGATVGGSLPNSLASTGHGIDSLAAVFPKMVLGDGMDIIPDEVDGRMLDHLCWPLVVSKKHYLSARPIVPLALSSGCYWRRCLFCPDRNTAYAEVPSSAIEQFLESVPDPVRARRPLIHLLDSALPPAALRRFLGSSRKYGTDFYGFARPTERWTRNGLIEEAAQSGLTMLQLGVESGSLRLLKRYHKGIKPEEAEHVMRRASRAGIRTYLYLLFGLPEETDRDRLATMNMITGNTQFVDFLNLSLFNLPRYCELTERKDEFDIEIQDFPNDDGGIRLYWPFRFQGRVPRDDARRFLKNTFSVHPAVHRIQLRTPKWLRAAHLALMRLPGRN